MWKIFAFAAMVCVAPAAFAAQPISKPPPQQSMIVKVCETGCTRHCVRTQRKRWNVCQALCGC